MPDPVSFIEEARRLAVSPGEVLVIKVSLGTTPHEAEQLGRWLKDALGDTVKVLILDHTSEVMVVREGEAPA